MVRRHLDLGPPLGHAAEVAQLNVFGSVQEDIFRPQIAVEVVEALQPRSGAGYLQDPVELSLVRDGDVCSAIQALPERVWLKLEKDGNVRGQEVLNNIGVRRRGRECFVYAPLTSQYL